MTHKRQLVLALLIPAVFLLMLGTTAILFYRSHYGTPPLPAPYYAPHPAATAAIPLDHVVIILEENKTAGSIIGNPAAPYLNQLARTYATATHYYAVAHPSLPNYLALTSGTTADMTTDCNPPGGNCSANVPSIANEIERSGRSWKLYAESMPAACTTSNSGEYAVKHNPFLYYPDIRDDARRCGAHDVPLTQLAADLGSAATLPNYAFISPNLCSDMHDCSVQTGDAWLAQHVPGILSSPAFMAQHSLLVITWDEGVGQDNHVAALFAGPQVKRGYTSPAYYSHYSLLRTLEDAWRLQPLTSNDRTAPALTDIFQ